MRNRGKKLFLSHLNEVSSFATTCHLKPKAGLGGRPWSGNQYAPFPVPPTGRERPRTCDSSARFELQEFLLPHVFQVLYQQYVLFVVVFIVGVRFPLGQALGFIQSTELMVRIQASLYLNLDIEKTRKRAEQKCALAEMHRLRSLPPNVSRHTIKNTTEKHRERKRSPALLLRSQLLKCQDATGCQEGWEQRPRTGTACPLTALQPRWALIRIALTMDPSASGSLQMPFLFPSLPSWEIPYLSFRSQFQCHFL